MIGLGVAKLFVSFHVASWDRADYRRSGTLEWECRPRLLTHPAAGCQSVFDFIPCRNTIPRYRTEAGPGERVRGSDMQYPNPLVAPFRKSILAPTFGPSRRSNDPIALAPFDWMAPGEPFVRYVELELIKNAI